MLTFSIYYPFSEECRFDTQYYRETHLPLVNSALKDLGLAKMEVVLGQPGMMNKHPHFFAVAHLYFEDMATMGAALKAKGALLTADIPRFTDASPMQEIAVVNVSGE